MAGVSRSPAPVRQIPRGGTSIALAFCKHLRLPCSQVKSGSGLRAFAPQ